MTAAQMEKAKLIAQLRDREKIIRNIIADMKSNHGTHAEYIKRLEMALEYGKGDQ